MKLAVNKNHFFLLVLYAVSLPFNAPYSKLTTVIMLLLAANWLAHRKFSFRNDSLLLMLSFYMLHAVGLAYTENMTQGIFELDKKIGFLILPIVLSGSTITRVQLDKILRAFSASVLLASIICLVYATHQYLRNRSSDVFFYHSLTEIVDMHAIYMAMYVSFAVFIIVSQYWQAMVGGSVFKKSLIITILAYFLVFLFLLSARTVILGFTSIIFVGLLYWGYMKKRLLMAGAVIFLLFLVFAALIFFNENNRERFKEAINYKSEYGIDKQYGGRSTRELIWSCAGKVIVERPLFGAGTGDAQDVLQACYIKEVYHPLTYQPDMQYNAHSQYLQTLVDLGATGLALLLLMLVSTVTKAAKNRDYLFLSFLSLFGFACITESMLELKQGITFFTFFFALFVCASSSRKSTKERPPL